MNKLISVATTTALALGLAVAVPAQAFAINRVDCNDPNFVHFQSSQTTCWANRGDTEVRLYGVFAIITGNNDVDVTFEGAGTRFYPRSRDQYPFLPGSTITHINIR